MFTIRVEHEAGERARRSVYECARYEVAYVEPRQAAAVLTMFGVSGLAEAGREIRLSSGEAAYVMNGNADTVDFIRTIRAAGSRSSVV